MFQNSDVLSFCGSCRSIAAVVDDQDPDLAPVEAAKKIIKYYTKRYIPEMVPNPGKPLVLCSFCIIVDGAFFSSQLSLRG